MTVANSVKSPIINTWSQTCIVKMYTLLAWDVEKTGLKCEIFNSVYF